ncbi:hypothetical protein KGY79_05820 [Candidatus Bipolaricaulota bacterium]|nr:hypothetical protein [Candidatus Bipolaricaulota bacterium]
MTPGSRYSGSSVFRVLGGLIVLVFLLSFVSPPLAIGGPLKLSLSYPDFSGKADLEISGFELGLTRSSKHKFGIGVRLGDDRSLSLGNWDLSPFILGTFSSEGVRLDDFTGGLSASYFDYKLGSWALSSTSRVWIGKSGYRVGGDSSYTLGNLSLACDLRVESGFDEKTPWFPLSKGNYWMSLTRGSLSGFENVGGNSLTLYGERRITLGDENFKWSQGVVVDSLGSPDGLGLVTRLGYRDSFLLVEVDGLKLAGWALQLTTEKLSIGFLETSDNQERYGIYLGYRGDRGVGVEIMRSKYDPKMTVNITVEW